ncbi:hypothetical protein RKD35_004060 [Streptomyces albogriseolus]
MGTARSGPRPTEAHVKRVKALRITAGTVAGVASLALALALTLTPGSLGLPRHLHLHADRQELHLPPLRVLRDVLPGRPLVGFPRGRRIGRADRRPPPEARAATMAVAASLARTAAVLLLCCLGVAQLGWILPTWAVALSAFPVLIALFTLGSRDERLGRWLEFHHAGAAEGRLRPVIRRVTSARPGRSSDRTPKPDRQDMCRASIATHLLPPAPGTPGMCSPPESDAPTDAERLDRHARRPTSPPTVLPVPRALPHTAPGAHDHSHQEQGHEHPPVRVAAPVLRRAGDAFRVIPHP